MLSSSDLAGGAGRVAVRSALAVAALLALAAPAHAVDGVREIAPAAVSAGGVTPGDAPGFPVTLSEPGSYVLTGSLVTTGIDVAIEITADDVTLDLNGFAVECRVFLSLPCASGGTGISGAGADNARVTNGTVKGHGSDGVVLGAGAHVRDVRAIDNGAYGIRAGDESRVESCAARGNGDIGIWLGDGSRVRDSLALRNATGIATGKGSSLTHSAARENTGLGITVGSGSTVIGNTASENGETGFHVSLGSTVADNVAFDNGGDGFDLGLFGSGANLVLGGRARDNTAGNNIGFGMRMDPPWAFSGNVVDFNNGGNANPQTSGGVALGSNLCGGTVGCP